VAEIPHGKLVKELQSERSVEWTRIRIVSRFRNCEKVASINAGGFHYSPDGPLLGPQKLPDFYETMEIVLILIVPLLFQARVLL
jgi:hypothetical protein